MNDQLKDAADAAVYCRCKEFKGAVSERLGRPYCVECGKTYPYARDRADEALAKFGGGVNPMRSMVGHDPKGCDLIGCPDCRRWSEFEAKP